MHETVENVALIEIIQLLSIYLTNLNVSQAELFITNSNTGPTLNSFTFSDILSPAKSAIFRQLHCTHNCKFVNSTQWISHLNKFILQEIQIRKH